MNDSYEYKLSPEVRAKMAEERKRVLDMFPVAEYPGAAAALSVIKAERAPEPAAPPVVDLANSDDDEAIDKRIKEIRKQVRALVAEEERLLRRHYLLTADIEEPRPLRRRPSAEVE
jgi:hypothetical protein